MEFPSLARKLEEEEMLLISEVVGEALRNLFKDREDVSIGVDFRGDNVRIRVETPEEGGVECLLTPYSLRVRRWGRVIHYEVLNVEKDEDVFRIAVERIPRTISLVLFKTPVDQT